MKVGNIGQAILLSIVAVAAVAFLVIQLKGRHAPTAQTSSANASASPNIHTASLELPRTVYGDPFTHPALPRRVPPKKQPVKPDTKVASLGAGGGLSGSLPYPVGGPPQVSPEAANDDAKKPPEEAKDSVELGAIMTEPRAVALFSVNGKPLRSYEIGESVTKRAKVAAIRMGSVELQLATGRRVLRVGGTTKI
jgi:hypothetical protein